MKVRMRSKVAGVAVVAGFATVGLGAGLALASVRADQPSFDTNASGQTIGSVQMEGPVPDLVSIDMAQSEVVITAKTDSEVGYIYSADWLGSGEAKSPESAAQAMKDRVDDAGDVWISVYAKDGKTIIGKLKIGHVESGTEPESVK